MAADNGEGRSYAPPIEHTTNGRGQPASTFSDHSTKLLAAPEAEMAIPAAQSRKLIPLGVEELQRTSPSVSTSEGRKAV